jgi:hypothetical protein
MERRSWAGHTPGYLCSRPCQSMCVSTVSWLIIPVQKPSSSKILIPLIHNQLGVLALHLLAEHYGHHQPRVASTHADNTDGSSCADGLFFDGVGWVQGGSRVYRLVGLSEQCVARQHVVTTLCFVRVRASQVLCKNGRRRHGGFRGCWSIEFWNALTG